MDAGGNRVGDKTRLSSRRRVGGAAKVAKTAREKLRELCECDEVIADQEILAHGRIIREALEPDDDDASSDDEVDEILEAERRRLNYALDLPVDTYSLTRINPRLPTRMRYGVRSGLTHRDMPKFSPLSRGLQGSAVAIAAFATTALSKPRCWNEMTIDRIVDDGDAYYCDSYDRLHTDDRTALTVLDLKRDLIVQGTHRVSIEIDDPAYAGKFRSDTPTELHIAKALDLFFRRYDAGVLTSSRLNIAVWRESRHLNIFDGQPRMDNLIPVKDGATNDGTAKLIVVRDLTGLLFVILERSGVQNEHFVLYGLRIRGAEPLPAIEDDPEEPFRTIGLPTRRPSGYRIQDKFRAVVRGSYHLTHSNLPSELRGRGHLVVAIAALIYSRLVNANKWTNAIVDLILNQANIYLVDLARVHDKKLDDAAFELTIDDVVADVILGVYAAKVNVLVNVVPGQGKKGKATIDTGLREFFALHDLGILEIKKTFYAVWRDGPKYYMLDPFGCDDEGFRVDPEDPENVGRLGKAAAAVTMNSSIDELIETILENTGNKEKDPFVVHGFKVMYVKTGTTANGSLDAVVVYRDKNTNRRPEPPTPPKPEAVDDCKVKVEAIPTPREDAERTKEAFSQYPESMIRAEEYSMRDDEPTSFVESEAVGSIYDETKGSPADPTLKVKDVVKAIEVKGDQDETPDEISPTEQQVKFIRGYRIVNPRRMILHGSTNCLDDAFPEASQGHQGLALALTAMAYARIKDPRSWRNLDVDQILRVGDAAHAEVVAWIRQGSPEETAEEEAEDAEKENEEDEEEEDEEGQAKEDDEGEAKASKVFRGTLKPAPSHIDVSMLPGRMKLGDNAVTYKKRPRVAEGDADPLANLGEALDGYFAKYRQVILENHRLMYGIWRHDEKYFIFNPYGADDEGWRLRDLPAAIVVAETINELADVLHGILEFNDRTFALHYVGIEAVHPGDKNVITPVDLDAPNDDDVTLGIYRTKFLPVTDDDITVAQPPSDADVEKTIEEQSEVKVEGDEDEEEDEGDEDDDDDEEKEKGGEEDKRDEEVKVSTEEQEPEKPLEDPLAEVNEQERPDAPERLNLSLLTGTVKVIETPEGPDEETLEAVAYERLKYSHPPPYVLPPRRVLCRLLEAKRASRSMHSLISRFSVDSKLAVKAATEIVTTTKIDEASAAATVSAAVAEEEKPVRIIKLPPSKYLFSRIPPEGFTPLRAIDETFIRDEVADREAEEECRRSKDDRAELEKRKTCGRDVLEDPGGLGVAPTIIPLGPVVRTPMPKKKVKACGEPSKARKSGLTSTTETVDKTLKKILCSTEDVLLDMIFPGRSNDIAVKVNERDAEENDRDVEKNDRVVPVDDDEDHNNDFEAEPRVVDSDGGINIVEGAEEMNPEENADPEPVGFFATDDDDVGIIQANSRLENSAAIEERHLKTCFFAAVLCILTKVTTDVSEFRGTTLDRLILASEKIARRTGKLRHKPWRRFRNVAIDGVTCDALVRQSVYADPENHDLDELAMTLASYLTTNRTGILSLGNAAYAFWLSDDDRCYVFDPYGCDDRGNRVDDETGRACLLQFCDLDAAVARIRTNNPNTTSTPYRIYSLSIAHMETTRKKRKRRRKRDDRCSISESEGSVPDNEPTETLELAEKNFSTEPRRELSLVELAEWATTDPEDRYRFDDKTIDGNVTGFVAMRNFNASAFEVTVLENDVTRPRLAPFRRLKVAKSRRSDVAVPISMMEPKRRKIYDRKFTAQNSLSPAIDLCVIAWSGIRDPASWGVRTIRAIFEAARELTFDSLLAANNTIASRDLTDRVLDEFTVGNYSFRAVFAPLHRGALFAPEGWNLAMSLKRLFDVPIYSGAYVTCADAHIGITKRSDVFYAWWTIRGTKNLRVVAAESFEDFLRLVVGAIGVINETPFAMRVVTISWARKLDPDCSDVEGLHETTISSLPQIHRRSDAPYDVAAIFRPTKPANDGRDVFVIGKVALRDRDVIREPRVKRCYFVAVLATMVKRDIVQSSVPAMIDRVIEIGERLYEDFDRESPKYHTEHMLRNFKLMSRVFDLRDCACALHVLTGSPSDFYTSVRRQLRRHFNRHTDGVIQFTNCCYGFWYSRANDAYYYFDPYQCDSRGRRVDDNSDGGGCLGVFPSICRMVRHMCVNRFVDTTGFIIHSIHIETIDAPAQDDNYFREDPMWVYLDYHWSFAHSLKSDTAPARRRKNTKKRDDYESVVAVCDGAETKRRTAKPKWNNYTVEVDNLVYSIWGTIGCYDRRFGARAGDNRAAICLATLAMQFLCLPSRWSAAILDSGVICGDAYYTESLKAASKRCADRSNAADNRFDLQTTLKVSPHVWTIGFRETKCGSLYGNRDDRPCLAVTLRMGLEETSNVVVECGAVTLGIVASDDGYYVIDPCWTGPPLFARNRGAVYALRCRNYDVLVYATTKIFNTNQRLEFKVTPVTLEFGREVCGPAAAAVRRTMRGGKMILMDALGEEPGSADGPDVPVPGALAVPDEDDYSAYRRKVATGLTQRFEDRAVIDDRPVRRFTDVGLMDNLISKSTAWHLNLGQSTLKKRSAVMSTIQTIEPCRGFLGEKIEPRSFEITEKIQQCDEYPRTIDLLVGKNVPPATTKILTRRKVTRDVFPSEPMDCLPGRKFVLDSSRREFDRRNRDMADEAFKSYKHRKLDVNGDEDDLIQASGEDEQPKGVNELVVPVESEIGDNVDE